MQIESYLTKHSNDPAELLRVALNQFGGRFATAEHFGVQPSTVARWSSRLPGADIRAELQNYLPDQTRDVYVHGHMKENGRERELFITLDREENITYSRLLAEGKDKAAEVFLLAAEHGEWEGVPALAGADWYYEDEDFYDDPDYEYEYDEYSIE